MTCEEEDKAGLIKSASVAPNQFALGYRHIQPTQVWLDPDDMTVA